MVYRHLEVVREFVTCFDLLLGNLTILKQLIEIWCNWKGTDHMHRESNNRQTEVKLLQAPMVFCCYSILYHVR